jgi:hypothetical protein
MENHYASTFLLLYNKRKMGKEMKKDKRHDEPVMNIK